MTTAKKPTPSPCAVCDKPGTATLNFSGFQRGEMKLSVEPLCFDCLCGFIEGATRDEIAKLIFKRRETR